MPKGLKDVKWQCFYTVTRSCDSISYVVAGPDNYLLVGRGRELQKRSAYAWSVQVAGRGDVYWYGADTQQQHAPSIEFQVSKIRHT